MRDDGDWRLRWQRRRGAVHLRLLARVVDSPHGTWRRRLCWARIRLRWITSNLIGPFLSVGWRKPWRTMSHCDGAPVMNLVYWSPRPCTYELSPEATVEDLAAMLDKMVTGICLVFERKILGQRFKSWLYDGFREDPTLHYLITPTSLKALRQAQAEEGRPWG